MINGTFNGCLSITYKEDQKSNATYYMVEFSNGEKLIVPDIDVFGIVDGKHSSMGRKSVTIAEESEKGIVTLQQECFCSNEDDLEYTIYTLNKEMINA